MTLLSGMRTAAAMLLVGLGGCSVLLNYETAQCSTTSDCLAKGPAFQGTMCSLGSCTVRTQTDPEWDAGSPGVPSEDGGVKDADRVVSDGGGCVSTPQCVTDNLDEPYVCRKPGDPCTPLKTKECPLIFGNFKDPNSIHFGAFLNVPATAPLSQMSTLNVQLAVNEFNGATGGIPGGPLGKIRPLVGIICRNDPNLVSAGADHIINKLGLHAVVAHLPSADLKTFFVNQALPKNAFVINPGFADNSLTSLSSQGLFWHVIGDIRDVAPPYAPLLSRVEAYVRRQQELSPESAVRVAMIVANRFAEQSIADTLTPLLQANGKSIVDNGPDFYLSSVPSIVDTPNADYSSTNSALSSFRPHIIIAVAREEFVKKILPAIDDGWTNEHGTKTRPFYILPTALSGNLDLLNYVGMNTQGGAGSEDKRKRVVGVAPASADDLTLYNQFLVRFRTAYPHFVNPGGFENFYDAVYMMAYAMFAAGSVPELSGPHIARGMQRVVTGTTNINVGPTNIADGFTALAASGNIRLNGTMGLTDFDPGVGARRGNGSVYCVNRVGGNVAFAYDVLRYNKADKSLAGTFSCFPDF